MNVAIRSFSIQINLLNIIYTSFCGFYALPQESLETVSISSSAVMILLSVEDDSLNNHDISAPGHGSTSEVVLNKQGNNLQEDWVWPLLAFLAKSLILTASIRKSRECWYP